MFGTGKEERRNQRPTNLKECVKLNWTFQSGRKKKKTSIFKGGMMDGEGGVGEEGEAISWIVTSNLIQSCKS